MISYSVTFQYFFAAYDSSQKKNTQVVGRSPRATGYRRGVEIILPVRIYVW